MYFISNGMNSNEIIDKFEGFQNGTNVIGIVYEMNLNQKTI